MSGQDIAPAAGEILVYQSDDGTVRLDARLQDETVWLTQQMMAELLQSSKQNIGQHLKNIFEEAELDQAAVVKNFFTTAADGKKYSVKFYNLDAIISVGYRVKSTVATRFRIWATLRLKEYIVKGFTMDDERLKNPPVKGSAVPDYFDELLERIRDIRASERRMYLRIREIFAMAGDYDPTFSETTRFFSIIQNKLLFAATGQTAAGNIRKPLAKQITLSCWKKRPDSCQPARERKSDEIRPKRSPSPINPVTGIRLFPGRGVFCDYLHAKSGMFVWRGNGWANMLQ